MGIAIGALVGLVIIAYASVHVASEIRASKAYDIQAEDIRIPSDAATIARGRRLVFNVVGCVECHGENLAGKAGYIDDPLLGRFSAANLTSGKGGVGRQFSDADFIRAIRHGIKPDNRSMLLMPVLDYVHLNADDLAAVVAYIKSVPPVDNELPPNEIRPLGRILLVTNQIPLLSAEQVDQRAPIPLVVPPGPTVEYGRYLALTSGCHGCHGAGLSGGSIPGLPPSFPAPPNITPAGAVAGYTDEEIMRVIREGRRPGGAPINPFMPFKYYSGMTDDEVRAIVAYLRTVPPRPYGNR